MAELVVDGAVLHYETWGESGGWVTLVNGHNRPLNDFRMLGRQLVQHGWRVLALDNRGSGQTTTEREFTLADMAADVAALWQAEGITTTALLGISMGGFIAQSLAGGAKTKSKVTRLILISTAMRQTWLRRDAVPWSTDPEAVAQKLRPYFTPEFAQRNAALVKGMAKQIAQAVAGGTFIANSEQQMQAVKGLDLSAGTKAITAPTLVLHGAQDEIIPLAAGEELAHAVQGAKLSVLPGVGHLLLAEAAPALYAAVLAVLIS